MTAFGWAIAIGTGILVLMLGALFSALLALAVRPRRPRLRILTEYACGHQQPEPALNLGARGYCRICHADQVIIATTAES